MAQLTICVTVDWEGLSLEEANLAAMEDFRQAFPDIPLTHFICPAYLTRGEDAAPLVAEIMRPIMAQDEVALHVHCWTSLVEAAGVAFRNAPSLYLGNWQPEVPYGVDLIDSGHGVPLGAYQPAEIAAILQHARGLLTHHQITQVAPVSFRCGAWMASDDVMAALRTAGLTADSSMTDAPWFTGLNLALLNRDSALGQVVPVLWGAAQVNHPAYLANTRSFAAQPAGGGPLTQPYAIGQGQDRVAEVPDNGVLADYLTENHIYARLDAARDRAEVEDTLHVCGFHQESATLPGIQGGAANLTKLGNALRRFRDDAARAAPLGKVAVDYACIAAVAGKVRGEGAVAAPTPAGDSGPRRFWG